MLSFTIPYLSVNHLLPINNNKNQNGSPRNREWQYNLGGGCGLVDFMQHMRLNTYDLAIRMCGHVSFFM